MYVWSICIISFERVYIVAKMAKKLIVPINDDAIFIMILVINNVMMSYDVALYKS